MTSLVDCGWELSQVGELTARLAGRGGARAAWGRRPDGPPPTMDDLDVEVHRAGAAVGLDAAPAPLSFPVTARALRGLAPAVLCDGTHLVGLVSAGRGTARVAALDGGERALPAARICDWLNDPLLAPHAAAIAEVLGAGDLSPRGGRRASVALGRAIVGTGQLPGCFVLRRRASESLWRQLRERGLLRPLAAVSGVELARSAVTLLAWWILGGGALSGELEPWTLAAWVLVLVTGVALSTASEWWEGLGVLGLNLLYRRKLLHGAMQLPLDLVRRMGSGALLSRAVEAEALDTLAVSAGVNGLIAALDLVSAGLVLLVIPGATPLFVLYATWLVACAAVGWALFRRQRGWTERRVAMSQDLAEVFRGRRTRAAQVARRAWHEGEDHEVARYADVSRRLDRARSAFVSLSGRGFMVLATLGVGAAVVAGAAPAPVVAAMVGAVLLAERSIGSVVVALDAVGEVVIAWGQGRVLYEGSASAEPPGLTGLDALDGARRAPDATLLEATSLSFGYSRSQEAVLEDVDLTVRRGERLVLVGRSGAGKSTLASLLSGLRAPVAGTLLLDGLDRRTRGAEEWARRIVYVPQFKDNHLFTGPLALNLLMGRRWPPRREDLDDARSVCAELGLGPLIERMPLGLMQEVGEGGWKLSHGERSRICVARALLQKPDLAILDESFGALDVATTRRCMEALLRRDSALLVIAHP